jgi:hypothetical protein
MANPKPWHVIQISGRRPIGRREKFIFARHNQKASAKFLDGMADSTVAYRAVRS